MCGQYAGLLPSCPEGPGLCLEPAINFSPNFERGAINWNCVIQLIIHRPGWAQSSQIGVYLQRLVMGSRGTTNIQIGF